MFMPMERDGRFVPVAGTLEETTYTRGHRVVTHYRFVPADGTEPVPLSYGQVLTRLRETPEELERNCARMTGLLLMGRDPHGMAKPSVVERAVKLAEEVL